MEVRKELRCGCWFRRSGDSSGKSVLNRLKFMKVG